MSERVDVLVVGAGTVGLAAALGLSQAGLRVALVDRKPLPEPPEGELDPRVVAVSPGSRRLLEALDAWPEVRGARIAPYHRMQVVAGSGGDVTFRAEEHGLPALGWIAELPELDAALAAAVAGRRRIRRFMPAELASLEIGADAVSARLEGGEAVEAGFVVGADGARSGVRRAAGIEVDTYDYNQRAVVAHLDTKQANDGLAWQRFTPDGPLALLPLPGGRSSLVWSVPNERADALASLDDDAFCEQVVSAAEANPFGAVTGTTTRHALPLIRRHARAFSSGLAVLVGDAARSVHPLAGQGLNLGLADVAALVAAAGSGRPDRDPTSAVARAARRRYSDATLVAGGIHAINELQRAGGAPGRAAMGLGFRALSASRLARDLFVQRACGLREVEAGAKVLEER